MPQSLPHGALQAWGAHQCMVIDVFIYTLYITISYHINCIISYMCICLSYWVQTNQLSGLTSEIAPAALACPGDHSYDTMNSEGHEGPRMPAVFQIAVSASRSSRVHKSKNVPSFSRSGCSRQTVQVTPCRLAKVSRWNSSTEWLPPATAAVS